MGFFVNEIAYQALGVYLKKEHPKNAECILDILRENKIAQKVFDIEMIVDPKKFSSEIRPFYDNAVVKCTTHEIENEKDKEEL